MIIFLIFAALAAAYNVIYGIHCARAKHIVALVGTGVMVMILALSVLSLGSAL